MFYYINDIMADRVLSAVEEVIKNPGDKRPSLSRVINCIAMTLCSLQKLGAVGSDEQ